MQLAPPPQLSAPVPTRYMPHKSKRQPVTTFGKMRFSVLGGMKEIRILRREKVSVSWKLRIDVTV